MKKPFAVSVDRYEGITKQAVNLLAGTLNAKLGNDVLPILRCESAETALEKSYTPIYIGRTDTHPILKKYADLGVISVPDKAEGYAVYVGKARGGEESDIILIAGKDESGVLYGCADFCTRYLAYLGYPCIFETAFFDRILEKPLYPYSVSEYPRIPTRAIWTWGHKIYDYRGFFENMARLRLNEIVIWNDRCPINAEDIVSYAHSLGIKVVWGFAWGWDQSSKLERTVAESDDAMLARIKAQVLKTFEEEYAGNGDGIYFQSFTEIHKASVNGNSVAERVTKLVNETAGALLSRYPELHIQFGLHATSVRTQTEIIAKTDPRIYIVWEDCGAFPYAYLTDQTEGFDETLDFTKKLLTLRGENERFGAVLKGLVCLDWGAFVHFHHPYVMGEHPRAFITRRTEQKRELWKTVTSGWMRNAEYARKTVAAVAEGAKAPILELLVEDGCFEEKIPFPVALMTDFLWNPEQDTAAEMERVAKYPCVEL